VISANAILVSSYALVRRCVHRTGRPTLGLNSLALVRAKIALFRLESASCSALFDILCTICKPARYSWLTMFEPRGMTTNSAAAHVVNAADWTRLVQAQCSSAVLRECFLGL
jgi:hypothetical protein